MKFKDIFILVEAQNIIDIGKALETFKNALNKSRNIFGKLVKPVIEYDEKINMISIKFNSVKQGMNKQIFKNEINKILNNKNIENQLKMFLNMSITSKVGLNTQDYDIILTNGDSNILIGIALKQQQDTQQKPQSTEQKTDSNTNDVEQDKTKDTKQTNDTTDDEIDLGV